MTGKSNEAGMVDACMVDGGRADDAFYTVKMSNVTMWLSCDPQIRECRFVL